MHASKMPCFVYMSISTLILLYSILFIFSLNLKVKRKHRRLCWPTLQSKERLGPVKGSIQNYSFELTLYAEQITNREHIYLNIQWARSWIYIEIILKFSWRRQKVKKKEERWSSVGNICIFFKTSLDVNSNLN